MDSETSPSQSLPRYEEPPEYTRVQVYHEFAYVESGLEDEDDIDNDDELYLSDESDGEECVDCAEPCNVGCECYCHACGCDCHYSCECSCGKFKREPTCRCHCHRPDSCYCLCSARDSEDAPPSYEAVTTTGLAAFYNHVARQAISAAENTYVDVLRHAHIPPPPAYGEEMQVIRRAAAQAAYTRVVCKATSLADETSKAAQNSACWRVLEMLFNFINHDVERFHSSSRGPTDMKKLKAAKHATCRAAVTKAWVQAGNIVNKLAKTSETECPTAASLEARAYLDMVLYRRVLRYPELEGMWGEYLKHMVHPITLLAHDPQMSEEVETRETRAVMGTLREEEQQREKLKQEKQEDEKQWRGAQSREARNQTGAEG